MSADEIYDTLTKIMRDIFDDDSIVACPALTAADIPGWDSFAQLRLIFAVERTFGVDFAVSDATFKSLGDLADLIHSNLTSSS